MVLSAKKLRSVDNAIFYTSNLSPRDSTSSYFSHSVVCIPIYSNFDSTQLYLFIAHAPSDFYNIGCLRFKFACFYIYGHLSLLWHGNAISNLSIEYYFQLLVQQLVRSPPLMVIQVFQDDSNEVTVAYDLRLHD